MKKTLLTGATLVLAGAFLSACDRTSYESNPVIVPTNYGDVTCQLYTKNTVWWDESISRPQTLSEEAADDICLEVGRKYANQ